MGIVRDPKGMRDLECDVTECARFVRLMAVVNAAEVWKITMAWPESREHPTATSLLMKAVDEYSNEQSG